MTATEVWTPTDSINVLRKNGPYPFLLTGAIVDITRNHFSTASNICMPGLRENLWNPDEKLSKILIDHGTLYNPRNVQQRPAVLINRADQTFKSVSIADRHHGAPVQDGYVEDTFTVQVNGSFNILCVERNGIAADMLGSEVGYMFTEFADVIQRSLCLHQFFVNGLSGPKQVDESSENFVTAVTMSYAAMHTWYVTKQTPIWARVNLKPTIEGE